jgi:uncharacterized protein YbaR (Trm112 family)
MKQHLLPLLACPVCRGGLDFEGTSTDERLLSGRLPCRVCSADYQVLDELPILKSRTLSAGEWEWEVDVSQLRDFDAIEAEYNAALPDSVLAAVSEMIEYILTAVTAGSGPILDVATGMGTLFRPLAARWNTLAAQGQPRECLASDVDESVLRGTQRKLRSEGHSAVASLLVSDAKRLALKDEVVESVVSFGGLANVPHGTHALREAARVLQSGGRIVFSTLLVREDSPSFSLAAEHGYGDLMSAPSVRQALVAAGFHLLQQKTFVADTWPGCPQDLLPLEGDWFSHSAFVAQKQDRSPALADLE